MNTATQPQDYLHIEVWGQKMGSYRFYVHDQQRRAFEAGAPINAIYEKTLPGGEPSGTWVTVDQCHPSVKGEVDAGVDLLKFTRAQQAKRRKA